MSVADASSSPQPGPDDPERVLQALHARTPARVLVGRAGSAYRTATQLELRQDHAAAVDAVRAEIGLGRNLGRDFVDRWGLVEVRTRAGSKDEYLRRPDLGRRLDGSACEALASWPRGADVQIVVGDGLSAAAVVAQVPELLPGLEEGARRRGWRFGRSFFVRYCRVGVLNDVGELLDPAVVVLLIGERPGLATAESLSAYLAYRPRAGHTDAHRNLIANIHARGTPPVEAAGRVLRLAATMMRLQTGGVAVKEELGGPGPDELGPRGEPRAPTIERSEPSPPGD